MERIKNHNNTIEAKYLDHELNKFKKEISMTRSRISVVHDNLENNSLTYRPLDNTKLISSFSQGHECVEDFYRDSENASLMEKRIFDNFTEPTDDEVPLSMLDNQDVQCIDEFMKDDTFEMTKNDERYVRFGDLIEIINYDEGAMTNSTQCSDHQLDNLSDDIVIEPILEVKLVPKEQLHNEPMELIGKPMQHSIGKLITTTHEKIHKTQSIEHYQNSCEDMPQSNQNPFIITKLNVIHPPQPTTNPTAEEIPFQIPPEQNAIVLDLFTKDSQSDIMRRNTLQKYFLRWIHFTTVERISKENISCNQSRIQKIEAFLNNIRLEKKKQLRSDQRVVDVKKKNSEPENPAVLARKYHHK